MSKAAFRQSSGELTSVTAAGDVVPAGAVAAGGTVVDGAGAVWANAAPDIAKTLSAERGAMKRLIIFVIRVCPSFSVEITGDPLNSGDESRRTVINHMVNECVTSTARVRIRLWSQCRQRS